MKIRTVKGPLGNRKYDVAQAGVNELILTGPKRETRRQRWERVSNDPFPGMSNPYVKARYRLAMRVHHNGSQMIMAPCQHPDGSLFYEYVEDSAQ